MQVPVYGPRKVETRPIAGVKQTHVPGPDVFGAGLGQALTRVGLENAAPAIAAARDQADQIAVLEAANATEAWRQNTLHHPDTGLLNTRKGKSAMGVPDEVLDGYEKFSTDIAAGLANDRQRLAYARIQAQTRDQIRSQVYQHTEREMTVFYDEQAKAGVALHVTGAIRAWDNPAVSSQKMQEAVAITRDHLKGQDEETTIKNAVLGVTSAVHEGVINQMLDANQDQTAQVYFEEYNQAGQINEDSLKRITGALEVGSLRGESQREAARIRTEGGTDAEKIEKAKQIKDPEVQDETLQRVKQDIATDRALKAQAKEDMMTNASQLVYKTKRFDAIPAHMITQMDSEDITRMKRFAESLQPGGTAIETDPEAYYRLREMAQKDPEKFKGLDLNDYITALGTGDRNKIIDLQMDMRQGKDAKVAQALGGFQNYQQILTDTLTLAGIDTGDTAETRKNGTTKKVAGIRRAMDQKVELAQSGGAKLSNDEFQKMADDLLKTVVVQQGAWSNMLPGGAPFSDVTKRRFEITITDIPENDRKLIAQSLAKKNLTPTPEAIINVWVNQKAEQGLVK